MTSVGEVISHRETKGRKKSLFSMCPISVLLPSAIFGDFKLFLCLKVKVKRFSVQKLQMNYS